MANSTSKQKQAELITVQILNKATEKAKADTARKVQRLLLLFSSEVSAFAVAQINAERTHTAYSCIALTLVDGAVS